MVDDAGLGHDGGHQHEHEGSHEGFFPHSRADGAEQGGEILRRAVEQHNYQKTHQHGFRHTALEQGTPADDDGQIGDKRPNS